MELLARRKVLKSRQTGLVIWFSLLIVHLIHNWCVHISNVVFKKTRTYHLERLKMGLFFFFFACICQKPTVYSLLQEGTSVSNWQNSGFIMGDSNEQNHFVIHSVGDYKLIRNPSPSPSLRSVLHFQSLVAFFFPDRRASLESFWSHEPQ